MAALRENKSVFSYGYRPQGVPGADYGFVINLLENGTLIFERYAAPHVVSQHHTFAVPQWLVERYRQDVYRASGWLKSMPKHMAAGAQEIHVSYVGLEGCPDVFRMGDLQQIIACPFGTNRGHYARMMFNLLEEVAGMLQGVGIMLCLDGFNWDRSIIRSYEEQYQTGAQPAMQTTGTQPQMQMYG